MLLLVCATNMEMYPLRLLLRQNSNVVFLVSGVGPVMTAMTLACYLEKNHQSVTGIINFGAGGVYVDTAPALLDICLATSEVLGDFGICYQDSIETFDNQEMFPGLQFDLKNVLLSQAQRLLSSNHLTFMSGNFVTVNCVSGTLKRGKYLRDKYQAICENMEGAALAAVCHKFSLPCLELRVISNFVEDRDLTRWPLAEAVQKCADVTAILVSELGKDDK